MIQGVGVSRRRALAMGAAAAALPLVHIRTAAAAGKLSMGFWDHWVPAGNDAMKKQVNAWAAKNKVDVQSDYITSVGNKNLLTIAAEAQAGTGHDVEAFPTWEVHNHAPQLEPVDDVVGRLIKQYGPINPVCEYLQKVDGHWLAVPSSSGTQNKPPCARIGAMKAAGIDVTSMYPAQAVHAPEADQWTWDAMLKAAGPCRQAGLPFALGLGQTTDSVDWVGSLFAAYGAELVNAKGDITVKSDNVRQVLEYMQKLAPELPPDVLSYDDASNNRALISGKSALIFNPPSAWAVAKEQNPAVAADCWTFSAPSGPKGRFVPYLPYAWGLWKYSANKSAAKDLIEYLCQREQVEERCVAVSGYDIPPFDSMTDFKIWAEVEPPRGTVFNYPILPTHNAQPHIAAAPASPDVAVQIYNNATMTVMIAKLTNEKQSMNQVLDWAQNELESYTR